MVFEKAKPLTVQDLSGSWKLQSIQGASTNVHFKSTEPFIEFNVAESRVTGNAGCNRFNGPFMFSNGKLTIENVVTTRATCQDQQGENLFVRLLSDTHDVEVDGDALILRKNGSETFRFVK